LATIAIGDVHGNLEALLDLLAQLLGELSDDDSLVFLGDYIDRGANSRGCIDAILSLQVERRATVACLRGNHEDWMLRTRRNHARHSWLMSMDAFETIRSYSVEAERTLREAMGQEGLQLYLGGCRLPYEAFFDAMPESHHTFFEELELSHEADGCMFTHAGVDPDVCELVDQTEDAVLWGKRGFPLAYTGDMTIIYGHWNNAVCDGNGWPAPRIVGNTIGIDTISHGVLTAIRMPDRRVFQSARYRPVDRNRRSEGI
jgi:serine/threonine protein phosphatase 1